MTKMPIDQRMLETRYEEGIKRFSNAQYGFPRMSEHLMMHAWIYLSLTFGIHYLNYYYFSNLSL